MPPPNFLFRCNKLICAFQRASLFTIFVCVLLITNSLQSLHVKNNVCLNVLSDCLHHTEMTGGLKKNKRKPLISEVLEMQGAKSYTHPEVVDLLTDLPTFSHNSIFHTPSLRAQGKKCKSSVSNAFKCIAIKKRKTPVMWGTLTFLIPFPDLSLQIQTALDTLMPNR